MNLNYTGMAPSIDSMMEIAERMSYDDILQLIIKLMKMREQRAQVHSYLIQQAIDLAVEEGFQIDIISSPNPRQYIPINSTTDYRIEVSAD